MSSIKKSSGMLNCRETVLIMHKVSKSGSWEIKMTNAKFFFVLFFMKYSINSYTGKSFDICCKIVGGSLDRPHGRYLNNLFCHEI